MGGSSKQTERNACVKFRIIYRRSTFSVSAARMHLRTDETIKFRATMASSLKPMFTKRKRKHLCPGSVCLQLLVSFIFLISNFRLVLNVVCFLLGNSLASEFCILTFRNTLSVPSSLAGRCV